MKSNSPFAKVNVVDIKKTGIHFAMIALLSFGLYLLTNVVPQVDFGPYSLFVVPIVSTGTDLLRRYLTNYQAHQA